MITILLENAARSTVLASGPYERYLAGTYAQAAHYYASCHPSAPNYLALTSGKTWQCGTDAYHVYSTTNVADLVEKAGETWGAYMESMPTPCDTSNTGLYATRHNPFIYYADIVQNKVRCDSHVLSFDAWNLSVAAGKIPNYAFLSPNVKNDGHDTGVAYADHWLKGWLSPYLTAGWFTSTVFFVVYDEGVGTAGYNGTVGGNVYFSAVSPSANSGFTYLSDASHYNLLSTVEWLLGLGTTGHYDGTPQFSVLKSLFSSAKPTPSTYSVSGAVDTPNGTGIVGATVVDGAGDTTLTGSAGTYAFSLPNGTYNLTASMTGYFPATLPIVVNGTNLTGLDLRLIPTSPFTLSLAANRTNGTEPLTVSFGAQPRGGTGPFSFDWNFGDGNRTNGSGLANVTHTFAESGVFNVAVTAIDAAGITNVSRVTLLILSALAVAVPNVASTNESVPFVTQASVQQGVVNYTWTFGDGGRAYGARVSHVYPGPGKYRVALWVNDSLGGSSRQDFTITVQLATGPAVAGPHASGWYFVASLFVAGGLGATFASGIWWMVRRRRGPPGNQPGWGGRLRERFGVLRTSLRNAVRRMSRRLPFAPLAVPAWLRIRREPVNRSSVVKPRLERRIEAVTMPSPLPVHIAAPTEPTVTGGVPAELTTPLVGAPSLPETVRAEETEPGPSGCSTELLSARSTGPTSLPLPGDPSQERDGSDSRSESDTASDRLERALRELSRGGAWIGSPSALGLALGEDPSWLTQALTEHRPKLTQRGVRVVLRKYVSGPVWVVVDQELARPADLPPSPPSRKDPTP